MARPQLFDPGTGPLPQLTRAIHARLELAFPSDRFIHGYLPANATPQLFAELVRRIPFVGLSWGGFTPDEEAGRRLKGVASWTVALIDEHPTVEGRLFGDAQGPGQLSMLTVGAMALHGHTLFAPPPVGSATTLGAALGSASVTAAPNLYAEGWTRINAAISGLTVTVGCELVPAVDLDDFLRLGAAWRFAGDADVAPDRAADLINVRA